MKGKLRQNKELIVHEITEFYCRLYIEEEIFRLFIEGVDW